MKAYIFSQNSDTIYIKKHTLNIKCILFTFKYIEILKLWECLDLTKLIFSQALEGAPQHPNFDDGKPKIIQPSPQYLMISEYCAKPSLK